MGQTTKRIEDYAHLYVGQQVQLTKDISVEDLEADTSKGCFWTLAMVDKGDCYITGNDSHDAYLSNMEGCWLGVGIKDFKLILRSLSSITNDEDKESREAKNNPEYFRWLLSKGFDIFGLIESGIALDSTKTNKENN